MTVEELVTALNANFPTINQIVAKFQGSDNAFNESKAIEYRNRNIIRLNEQQIPYSNQIEHLVYNTNVSTIGIGAINFTTGIKLIDSTYKKFASYNDYYSLCYDPAHERIISYTEEFSELNVLSTSIDQFLTFLYLYERYDKNFIFGEYFPEPELRERLNYLILEGFSKDFVEELIFNGLNKEAQ